MRYKIPLVLTPQSGGGFTVTSPLLPELITEGDTVEDALANVREDNITRRLGHEAFKAPRPGLHRVFDDHEGSRVVLVESFPQLRQPVGDVVGEARQSGIVDLDLLERRAVELADGDTVVTDRLPVAITRRRATAG